MAKMRPEIKKQWLEALRSGEYKQGKGVLHNIGGSTGAGMDEFCCLGVLCDLAHKAGAVERQIVEIYDYGDVYDYGSAAGMPSAAVVAWAFNVQPDNGSVDRAFKDLTHAGSTSNTWLPGMNDHDGYTFEEIADVIEKGDL